MDESESAEAWAECEEVSTRLLTELTKVWPQREDLHPGEAMPICREIPVPATGDLDSWSAEVIGLCKELAKTLSPALKSGNRGFQMSGNRTGMASHGYVVEAGIV